MEVVCPWDAVPHNLYHFNFSIKEDTTIGSAGSLNVNSFPLKIRALIQIVGGFQEPYYSHDTSLISIMYAKPDTFDSEDNVAGFFLNLQIMHVLQYSRCLHSIKHLTKNSTGVFGDVCID